MNRIVLIGNGFDLAHGLKTSYNDFINWYWGKRVDELGSNQTRVSEDSLCKLSIRKDSGIRCWSLLFACNPDFIENRDKSNYSALIPTILKYPETFDYEPSSLLETIMQSVEEKGWVDIENDYYQLIKSHIKGDDFRFTIKELNEQMEFLKSKLAEYLSEINPEERNDDIHKDMISHFNIADISTEGRQKAEESIGLKPVYCNGLTFNPDDTDKHFPERIMLLSFNYTSTARLYENYNIQYNYIHGELKEPKNIIFGYGDELDKQYQDILDRNDNELLRNVKSVKYLETRRYREMLEFLQSAAFQVFIMGHSCGNSDRTLLNTIFEHENCVSIKPFFHKWEDGTDNYLNIVQNISRNFTDMKLFRDRVVNKEQCLTI